MTKGKTIKQKASNSSQRRAGEKRKRAGKKPKGSICRTRRCGRPALVFTTETTYFTPATLLGLTNSSGLANIQTDARCEAHATKKQLHHLHVTDLLERERKRRFDRQQRQLYVRFGEAKAFGHCDADAWDYADNLKGSLSSFVARKRQSSEDVPF